MDHASRQADELKRCNRIIKECLRDPNRLASLNSHMASAIANEIAHVSLARRILAPKRMKKGEVPSFSANQHGPVVVVNLFERVKRVLYCKQFRDSLREEEVTTTVRDIQYLPMLGTGIHPSSFTLSNVVTTRRQEFNGNAFRLVERARQKMKLALAHDETRIVLKALIWVCESFGRISFSMGKASTRDEIEVAIRRIGRRRNPMILGSLKTLLGLGLKSPSFDSIKSGTEILPIGLYSLEGRNHPAYFHDLIPEHQIMVIPSGAEMGQYTIFSDPKVRNYDKPERMIKGWQLIHDQGIVFRNPRLTSIINLGWRGVLEGAKLAGSRMLGNLWVRKSLIR